MEAALQVLLSLLNYFAQKKPLKFKYFNHILLLLQFEKKIFPKLEKKNCGGYGPGNMLIN